MDVPKLITRQAFEYPIFCKPRDFLLRKLPTHECLLQCCFEERFKLSIETNNKSISFSQVAMTVAEKIEILYNKTSIPTVSDYRIVQVIHAYHDSYYKIRNKCTISVNCTCKKTQDAYVCAISINCTCEKAKKIPAAELRLILLQRKYGLGKLGSLDLKLTNKLNESFKCKTRELQQA
ncbi:hypothetical protein PR048_002093 [Dryococelus australis]|uniref:SWIM-type domain-containing protein n=1 Tax=Dryococelus australis TaxID=614101 RepID=A0ABQ9IJ77_9NEOP|nr:hypothetical protein PR048_002093 [Dryococelus australis]